MKLLTNKHLFERELGNYLFSIPALLEWAKAKGYFLRTDPELDGFGMAQVESVLCAIERAARPNLDDAREMVAAAPHLAGHRMADDAHGCAWLIGADAHGKWRKEFTRAIDDGELKLFDATSLMPVRWPPAPSGTTERVAREVTSDDWKVSARDIADECFDRDTKNKCRDSLAGYSRRVMDEMQERKIPGPRGVFDNSNTIQREALQGPLWWQKKQK